jgi:cytochrome b6-f complex iron-sulfur subunit
MTEFENTTNPNVEVKRKFYAHPGSISRRDFIQWVWQSLLWISGILGLAGLWRYFSFQPYPSKPTIYDLGPVDQLPKNAIFTVSGANAAVIASGNSYTAISLVCPHLGCIVELYEGEFVCPCHNSRFTTQGELLKGPSVESLRDLKLEINEDNHLLIDIS